MAGDEDFSKNISMLDRLVPSRQRLSHFLTVQRLIKNWHTLAKLALMPNSRCTFVLKSGSHVEVHGLNNFLDFWHSEKGQIELLNGLGALKDININRSKRTITFRYMGREIRFLYSSSNGMLAATLEWIRTQFFEEQYAWLDVKDAVVIDIGASVGDTAIYFALRGAKRVYGFETDVYRARQAMENVRLNEFGNIKIINAGCGKPGFAVLDARQGKVRIKSLKGIVEKYKLKNAVLKMDCEGCEYYSLLNANDTTLRAFKQIMLEYHHGYKNIKKRLVDAGFRVKHTRPEIFRTAGNDGYLGFLHGERR